MNVNNNYFVDYVQQLERATREALKGVSSPYQIPLNYLGVYSGRKAYMTAKGLVLSTKNKPSNLELKLEGA